jgi:predicted GNAT family N-acyltransferase
MTFKFIVYGSNDYKEMVKLREDVLRKPLGLSFSAEALEIDQQDLLLGLFEEEQLVACCILSSDHPQMIRLRQMAVRNDIQSKGLGRALIGFAEQVTREKGFHKIYMHARAVAKGFYEKLGYSVCSPEYVEVSIPHYTMEKQLF